MSDTAFTGLILLAGALFAVGCFGVLARRAILVQLLSLEIALSGPALAFIVAGARHGQAAGQGMFVLILVLAAAEVALGLALYLRLRRRSDVTDSDTLRELRH
ncbi:NADH-quinone oxidoreductase subunit NuoK [Rhodobacter sp. Har01]|uniref:NADH-quinone oxidoreductase subunit NuoK n=1 Tax=Rhodobacter sp. Har01 TaxID=2883999 RepID=UPI001D065CAD|nr:NADH-quinone oxidoreductase subunit NuoK [Rhodobacter sp. Har01]MCB6179928.1 NADH-quinone oxidoreductase subunit NuoK [Rhodobacter sp. Har01]